MLFSLTDDQRRRVNTSKASNRCACVCVCPNTLKPCVRERGANLPPARPRDGTNPVGCAERSRTAGGHDPGDCGGCSLVRAAAAAAATGKASKSLRSPFPVSAQGSCLRLGPKLLKKGYSALAPNLKTPTPVLFEVAVILLLLQPPERQKTPSHKALPPQSTGLSLLLLQQPIGRPKSGSLSWVSKR